MMELGPELKKLDSLFSLKERQITTLKALRAAKAPSVISQTSTQWLITQGPWRKSSRVKSGFE